jgi:hypothetical protein
MLVPPSFPNSANASAELATSAITSAGTNPFCCAKFLVCCIKFCAVEAEPSFKRAN